MSRKKTPFRPVVIALLLGLAVGVSYAVLPGLAESGVTGDVYEGRDGQRSGKDGPGGPGGPEADPDWFVTDVWGGTYTTEQPFAAPQMYVFGPYGGVLNWLFGQLGHVFFGFDR